VVPPRINPPARPDTLHETRHPWTNDDGTVDPLGFTLLQNDKYERKVVDGYMYLVDGFMGASDAIKAHTLPDGTVVPEDLYGDGTQRAYFCADSGTFKRLCFCLLRVGSLPTLRRQPDSFYCLDGIKHLPPTTALCGLIT
jgi:hypothetical protein